MNAETRDLPFDVVRVRLKIHELRKQVLGLEALLESYGLPVDAPHAATITPTADEPRRLTLKRRRSSGRKTGQPARANQQPKLADLGVEVITKHGGRAHGKLIVRELQQAGHLRNVSHPDSNISTALSRDQRVARASDARNTWVLKQAG